MKLYQTQTVGRFFSPFSDQFDDLHCHCGIYFESIQIKNFWITSPGYLDDHGGRSRCPAGRRHCSLRDRRSADRHLGTSEFLPFRCFQSSHASMTRLIMITPVTVIMHVDAGWLFHLIPPWCRFPWLQHRLQLLRPQWP